MLTAINYENIYPLNMTLFIVLFIYFWWRVLYQTAMVLNRIHSFCSMGICTIYLTVIILQTICLQNCFISHTTDMCFISNSERDHGQLGHLCLTVVLWHTEVPEGEATVTAVTEWWPSLCVSDKLEQQRS